MSTDKLLKRKVFKRGEKDIEEEQETFGQQKDLNLHMFASKA